MQILQSDLLSNCTLSAIGVQWLEVFYEMAMFFPAARKVVEEHFGAN